jgi:hypothetical protein
MILIHHSTGATYLTAHVPFGKLDRFYNITIEHTIQDIQLSNIHKDMVHDNWVITITTPHSDIIPVLKHYKLFTQSIKIK